MRATREILIGGLLALAIIAAGAGTAQAELSFSSPQTLFPVDTAAPRIGVDGQGRATVVAQQAGTGGSVLVQVDRLTPAGLPEPVDTLEEVANIGQCVCASLVVDPAGRATVLWVAAVEGERRLAFSQIGDDGVPGPVQLLSPPGVDGFSVAAAVAPDGSVGAAWRNDGPEPHLEVARIDPEGNPGEAQPLTEPGEGGVAPALAAGPDSSFHVAWGQGAYGGVDYAVVDEEGNPSPIQAVSPEGGIPAIVVDGENRATIAWDRGFDFEDEVVRLDAEGNPGTVRPLSPPETLVLNPKLAVDGQDRVTAIFEGSDARVFSTRLAADGSPEDLHQLSPEGHIAGEAQIAAADDGRVVVVWNHAVRVLPEDPGELCGVAHFEPEDDVVRAAVIGSDGEPTGVYDVSAYGEEAAGAQLALDPLGLPFVTWKSYDGTYFCEHPATRVQEAHGLEAQPPEEAAPEPPADPRTEPAPAAPKLRLAKRGVLRDGRVLINAGCYGGAGARCAGAIHLESALRHLAHGRFRIAAGRARKLALPISGTARRLLASGNPAWITASARGRGLTPKTVRIRVLDIGR